MIFFLHFFIANQLFYLGSCYKNWGILPHWKKVLSAQRWWVRWYGEIGNSKRLVVCEWVIVIRLEWGTFQITDFLALDHNFQTDKVFYLLRITIFERVASSLQLGMFYWFFQIKFWRFLLCLHHICIYMYDLKWLRL